MADFTAHLTRQAAVSRALFGPGPRTEGICDHIAKELNEISIAEHEDDRAHEWVDVAILALDGLLRSIWAFDPHLTAPQVADRAVKMLEAKQSKNEKRTWPDWRTVPGLRAIEHIRGHED